MTTAEFADRVAIVTGSSSGIGEAIAHRLSALGATVVVNSSNSVEAGEAVSPSTTKPYGGGVKYKKNG